MIRYLPIIFLAIFLFVMYPCQTLAGRITPEKTELGFYSTASGQYSTAMGFVTTASGNYSTALGSNTTAYSAFETVIGTLNTFYEPVSTISWQASDRLFVIGNGVDPVDSRSDAMVVLKNGNVGIGNSTPTAKLHVSGGSVNINNPGEGNVLLYLGTERHWQLRQLAADQYTALELASVGGGGNKDFIITTNGQVGIGTTGPSAYFHVDRSGVGSYDIFKVSSGSFPKETRLVVVGDGRIGIGNSNPDYLLEMESSGGGYYSATDHQWHNGSSRAIKQDIKENKMDILKTLDDVKIVNYRYKTEVSEDRNAPYHIGFIAEDTPQLLSGKNKDGMAMGDCIGLLMAAVKEQQKTITELTEKLSVLENKLNSK